MDRRPALDSERFDGIVRSLAHPTSRRSALGALAGALAVLGFEQASATSKPRHVGSRHNAKPASDAGDRRQAGADRARDPDAGGKRHKGRHHKRCDDGLTSCPAKHHKHLCVDLQTDAAHCGQCKQACDHGQPCQAGQCVGSCNPDCGDKQCGDDGCGGSCGACDAGKVCKQGACACPNGTSDCGGVCQQCCSPADCPSAPCSEATCINGTCGLNPIAGCCQNKSDCDDENPCTIDDCVGNVCQHNPAAVGATCGDGQTCCGATCCGGGQTCQNGSCAAPCTPTTCAALGRTCGTAPDGCGGTLDCGDCPSGKFCSSGHCAGCSVDSDCTSGGPCKVGSCFLDPRTLRGHCQYAPIPGCCTSNADCHLNPCDASVSCVDGQCAHVSSCSGCMSCGADGSCSVANCPECQYCGPGYCKADTSKNGQDCVRSGVCWNGQCGCIPNGERCGGASGVSGCCSGSCKGGFLGFFCSSPGV
jgi:hypothetical protein